MGIKITIPNTSSDTLTFGSANTTTAAQIAGIDSGSSNGQLALYTTASGTSTERVRVDSSGNVGIGTASPTDTSSFTRALDLNGTSGAGYYARTNGSATNYTLFGNYGSDGYINNRGAGSFIVFNNSAERMRIDSSGNLLVGATGTVNNERLRVDANITSFGTRLLNSNANPQGVTVGFTGAAPNGTGNPFIACGDTATDRFIARSNGGLANYSANNVNLASDLRLKHDIEPVQSYWNVFKSIEWKTWLYNDQTDEIKNIGVIAQELQALAPELVCESNALPTPEGESPYLGLWENDFKMAGMSVITELVKRCEEQQAIITSLTDRITALENK